MSKLKVHKTCQNWGETICGIELYTPPLPKTTTYRWDRTTCKNCLKKRKNVKNK